MQLDPYVKHLHTQRKCDHLQYKHFTLSNNQKHFYVLRLFEPVLRRVMAVRIRAMPSTPVQDGYS